jgi:hypothetical protein
MSDDELIARAEELLAKAKQHEAQWRNPEHKKAPPGDDVLAPERDEHPKRTAESRGGRLCLQYLLAAQSGGS